MQEIAVDARDNFRNRVRADVADLVRLGHLARNVALNGAAFVEARVIGRHVGAVALVAGGVLELHIREFGGDRIGRVHIAKRGGEDDVAAAQSHLGQNALSVGAFRHVFLILDLDLIAVSRLHGQSAFVVLEGPAAIADGADVDEAGLDLVHPCSHGRAARKSHAQPKGCGGQKGFSQHSVSPRRWGPRRAPVDNRPQREAWKFCPKAAGAFSDALPFPDDMMTNTTMVIR